MLVDDLHAARSPAVALLLVILEGIRQQPMAITTVGVMLEPTLFEDREAEIGILADRILGPAAGILQRRAAHEAHRAMGDDGVGFVAQHHADIEEAGIFGVHRAMQGGTVAVAVILRCLHEADARIGEGGNQILQPIRIDDVIGIEHADDLGFRRGMLQRDPEREGLEALHLTGIDILEARPEQAAMLLHRRRTWRHPACC